MRISEEHIQTNSDGKTEAWQAVKQLWDKIRESYEIPEELAHNNQAVYDLITDMAMLRMFLDSISQSETANVYMRDLTILVMEQIKKYWKDADEAG